MRAEGLEPPSAFAHGHLKPACFPVSPRPRIEPILSGFLRMDPTGASERLGSRAACLGAVRRSDKEVALTWQVSAGANLVIGAAFLAIAGTIAFVLFRGGRLWTHRLGQAALLAFGTCGVQFCLIAALLLAPSLGVDSSRSEELREAW